MPATLQFEIKDSGYGEMYHETFQPGRAPRIGILILILNEQAMAFSIWKSF